MYEDTTGFIHVRVQQNHGKNITTIEGLSTGYFEALRKKLNCGGNIRDTVIQLQGDQRQRVIKFLVDNEIVDKNWIKVH